MYVYGYYTHTWCMLKSPFVGIPTRCSVFAIMYLSRPHSLDHTYKAFRDPTM